MRIRILVPVLALLLAASMAVAIPTLTLIARDRTRALAFDRSQALDRFTALARSTLQHGDPAPLQRSLDRYYDLYGESVLVVDTAGTLIASAGSIDPDARQIRSRAINYGYNVPDKTLETIQPWSERTTLMSTPVEVDDDLGGGIVVLQVETGAARADVRLAWALVIGGMVGALAVLVGGTLVVARWVLRPVHDLDLAAHALASGSPPDDIVASGPPELRRLATSFSTMADALSDTLRQQADLVSNTSHNLRNPLAAVRLRIDLLSQHLGPELQPSIEGVQLDLDRLDDMLAGLLMLAAAEHRQSRFQAARAGGQATSHPAQTYSLDVRDVAQRWSEYAERVGAVVSAPEAATVVRTEVPRSDVEAMVDTLIENAFKYGGQGVQVQIGARSVMPGTVELVVEDDGDGLAPAEIAQAGTRFWRAARHADVKGTGLGLAIVKTLAAAHEGEMSVARSDRGGLRVAVLLPGGPA